MSIIQKLISTLTPKAKLEKWDGAADFFVETKTGFIPADELPLSQLSAFSLRKTINGTGRKTDDYFCPTCVEFGKASKVGFGVGHYVVKAEASEFWDDEDNLHVHDATVVRQSFICEAGHTWTEDFRLKKCWCGWTE